MRLITTRKREWLQAAGCATFLAGMAALGGCQPQLDPQEYGEVLDSVPVVEGADTPYPLPELDKPERLTNPKEPQDTPE